MSEERRKSRINARLHGVADILPKKIEKKRAKNKDYVLFLVSGMEYFDAKTFSGYERMHRVCAEADVRIERKLSPATLLMLPETYIYIYLGQPYSASSEAKLFAPKTPVTAAYNEAAEKPVRDETQEIVRKMRQQIANKSVRLSSPPRK